MEREDFIRKIVRMKGPEKAPDGMTDKIMSRISTHSVAADVPLLSTGAWIAIIVSAAALFIFVFVIDIPIFGDLISSTGILNIPSNVFTEGFMSSIFSFFKGIHISSISLTIIGAAALLGLMERLFFRKITGFYLMII